MTKLRRRTWLPLVVILVATIALLLWATPRPAQVSPTTSGDPALAADLRRLAEPDGHQSIAAAVITPDSVTHAAIGETAPGSQRAIQPGDPIELGSITKTFNGQLLADAAARDEVALEDPLQAHLPELDGTPLGGVTIVELASHRGGVPPLPPSLALQGIPMLFNGDNPYAAADRERILTEAQGMELTDDRGSFVYSNLGSTLLGWALAEAAGAPDWDAYVHDRLLDPLGVDATFARTQAEVPPGTVPAFTGNGFRPDHWATSAFQPAGVATYTTPDDITAYAQALLSDRAPGSDAMEPRFDAGQPDVKIGLHWLVRHVDGADLTWHNGGTGGFRTVLILDRSADRAVFVVGNTDTSVDDLGFALLAGGDAASEPSWWLLALAPGVAALLVALAWWSAWRGKDRPSIIGSMAGALVGLIFARVLGQWAVLGSWLWVLLVLAAAAALVVAVRRWPALPWRPRKYAVLSWINAALSVAVAVAALWLTV